jgi:hypothetical protein
MPSIEATGWAAATFGRAKLGHHARKLRVVQVAAAFADTPTGVITEANVVSADREGAYRLLENENVDPEVVAAAAHDATASTCLMHDFVFVPVDGSSLRMQDPLVRRGTGPIGARTFDARGFQVMSALAVDPDGVPLGLCAQKWWARPEQKVTRKSGKRPVEEKETQHWLTTLRDAAKRFEGSGCIPWFQLDRGGDAWPVLLLAHTERIHLTVRAAHNRRLMGSAGGERKYLWPQMREAPVLGHYQLDVPGGPNRTARTATLAVRVADVTLAFKDHWTKRLRSAPVWAILASELEQSAGSGERIEWMLLTTHPIETFEDAGVALFGYSMRWRIELFHRAWKSGATEVEKTQVHTARAIWVVAVVLAAVATRLLRMTYLSRTKPDLPANVEFSDAEIRAVLALKKKRRKPSATVTIADMTTWIAELGGYTGRSSGGPPGFINLNRGLRRIRDATELLASLK